MPPRAQAIAPPPAPDARFAFSYFGNPTTIEDCVSAVCAHPVLLMGPENVLTKLMPGALDYEAYKPNVGVSMYAINFMFDGGIIMEPTLLNQGVHFIWKPERLQKICKDLDAGGMAWEPIEGIDVIAIPKAARAITSALRTLPDDQRLFVQGDLLYDSTNMANADTKTWFDAMTPQLLISGWVNGMEMLAQFGSIIPDWFTKDNRKSDEFVSALAQIKGSVGRDISSLPIARKPRSSHSGSKEPKPRQTWSHILSTPCWKSRGARAPTSNRVSRPYSEWAGATPTRSGRRSSPSSGQDGWTTSSSTRRAS